MAPTPEQQLAVDLFRTGTDMVIVAGAGAGKTFTLRLLAEARRGRGLYVGFNRAIVVEAKRKMPRHVTSSTAHALAFRAVGREFADRLEQPRLRSEDVAKAHDIQGTMATSATQGVVRLDPGDVAGIAIATLRRFYTSAEPEPDEHHLRTPDWIVPSPELAATVLPIVLRAWQDIQTPKGIWPFDHNAYLKIWSLSQPVLPFDFILFDEAQDANPAMTAVIAAQNAQRVFVGDPAQAIYEFNGAQDAIAKFDGQRCQLTQSFRFGPAIAAHANELLALPSMTSTMRIVGTPSIRSSVAEDISDPDAVLCRTNAGVMDRLITMGERVPCAVVGGTKDVERFAFAAAKLRKGEPTTHPELACFRDWSDVCHFVKSDAAGTELAAMVGLVNRFGVRTVVEACRWAVPADKAQRTLSTAHKAKGAEWNRILIHSDWPDGWRDNPAEARLAYVSVTRARLALGYGPCAAEAAPDPQAGPATEIPERPGRPEEGPPPDRERTRRWTRPRRAKSGP